MMRKWIVAVFVAMAFTAGITYSAQSEPMLIHPGHHKGHPDCPFMKEKCHPPFFFGNPEMFKQKLGLTDQQIAKIEKINLDYRKRMLEQKEKLEPKRIQLERLLLEENVNLTTVRNLLREIADIRIEIHVLKIMHRLDIEKVLTQEQKAKLKAMRPPFPKMQRGMPHHGAEKF
ncbi:MAG: Spy/CpxP family protein refolding chaperone [Spirochaetes bacterium]|nr:Spy/CpxP family protein refolding chaperone [Spirochaetota bacterium]